MADCQKIAGTDRWRHRGGTVFTWVRTGRRASSNIEFLGVIPERPEAHAEHLGGLDLYATSTLERQRNVMTVEVLSSRLKVEPFAEIW
jgi:hypothetical protein